MSHTIANTAYVGKYIHADAFFDEDFQSETITFYVSDASDTDAFKMPT